jgi:hypothetical protein
MRTGILRHPLILFPALFCILAAFFWYALPYEPRFTFPMTGDDAASQLKLRHRLLRDMSSDGSTILVRAFASDDQESNEWTEYWNTATGERIEDPRSQDLQQFCAAFRGPNPFGWDLPLGERFVQTIRSIEQRPDFKAMAEHGGWWYGHSHPFSDNGRYLKYPVVDGLPQALRPSQSANGYAIVDLSTGNKGPVLRDCCGVLLISPDGRTAVTEYREVHKDGNFASHYMLSDLQTGRPRLEFPSVNELSDCAQWVFYSSDGQHVFAKRFSRETGRRELTWWDLDGREVATIRFIVNLEWKQPESFQALVDYDRVLVTFDSENEYHPIVPLPNQPQLGGSCRFWDVATGEQLGCWHLRDSNVGIESAEMLCGREGRFVALRCMRGQSHSIWDKWKWTNTIRGWFVRPDPLKFDYCLILLDAVGHGEVARLPAKDGLMSRDGRVLVTIDEDELVSVWDLPLTKPRMCILGFAAIGTAGCWAALFFVVRIARLARKTRGMLARVRPSSGGSL